MRFNLKSVVVLVVISVACQASLLIQPAKGVEIANIEVLQNDSGSTTASVSVSIASGQSTSDFSIAAGSIRGDYRIQIGTEITDDYISGILLTSIRQNGRDNLPGGDATVLYSTTSTDRVNGTSNVNIGSYSIAVDTAPGGGAYNSNVAAAYFNYSQGWLGGNVRNSTNANGGALNTFFGSPSLSIGTNFVEENADGNSRLYLPGVNTKADGLLFVTHAKNEDNFALSRPSDDGTYFRLETKDNGDDGGGQERDPVGFLYVPLGTQGITMGRIHGLTGGAILGQGDFKVIRAGTGTYQLSIAGETPQSGVLIITPEGMNTSNVDNIVSYQASGNNWLIQTRDTPSSTTAVPGLQNLESFEGAFNFMFIPFNNIPTSPGTYTLAVPNATAAGNVEVTEYSSGNGDGAMNARVLLNRQRVGIYSQNRGDNVIAVGGNVTAADQGVVLASVRQFSRVNTALTGFGLATIFTTAADTANNVPSYFAIATSRANSADFGEEFNVNFAVAHFPNSAGFKTGHSLPTLSGMETLTLADVGDTRTSGVLMVNGQGNYALITSASANADGTGWDIHVRSNLGILSGSGSAPAFGTAPMFAYAYLPYDTEGLVAGRINADGSILNSTDTSGFSITREDTGLYRLTIVGETPDTGTLLLNGGTDLLSSDNFLVYRDDNGDFLIGGFQAGTSPFAEDTNFSFAFISANNPLVSPAPVPEPSAIALGLMAAGLLAFRYRRRK